MKQGYDAMKPPSPSRANDIPTSKRSESRLTGANKLYFSKIVMNLLLWKNNNRVEYLKEASWYLTELISMQTLPGLFCTFDE